MKTKLLLLSSVFFLFWAMNSGFTPNEDSPRWNPDPRTRININPQTEEYSQLPTVDYSGPVVNSPQYIQTQQGVMVVNSAFRVHPVNVTSHQTEVPITRHPTNPLIMYGSANTSRGGNFSTAWYVTTDGGTTWTGNDTLINGSGSPVFNFGDPGPVIDGTGRFIISYITLTGAMGTSYSVNNGANWTNTYTFPGATTSSDKNFSSTDDVPFSPYYLRSYTYYTEFASGSNYNRIVGTYTTNQGVSWSTIAPVSPTPSSGHFHQGVDTKVGPNGEVYAVWTTGVNASPFTEDYLGFAKSTNGGVNWVISNENVANVNGNRTFNMMNNLRVAGFPRIDVDRTCGARAGWIYVCMGEKNPGVAGDISDITLYKSTNGGTTWSSGVKVNQDGVNGSKQYMGAIRVDESGGVNVVYYDTRNIPTGDSAEVYLSRSTDGGVTFTDVKVGNKFKHKPTGIGGVNTSYAGDYIGITSALIEGNPVNGNQRIWPYWTSNESGFYNAWTAKVELIPSNPCFGCEDFSSTAFTPKYFNLEFSGPQFWTRQTPSAYGAGTGSAKMDFFSASVFGSTHSLVTHCDPTPAGYYLTFDEAYAPYGANFPGPDSLYVESSTNGGLSYTKLAGLSGKYPSGGELNTAPATTSSFVPSSSQWASKIYSLPTGTNTVRLRAVSGYGNNLYIDNVCIQPLANPVSNSICVMPEGFYRATPSPNVIQDTVRVYLKRTDFPNIAVDSAVIYISNIGCTYVNFSKALSGNYHLVFKHRNSIETWTKAGNPIYTRGIFFSFDLINNNAVVFGNNQALADNSFLYYGNYGGDIDRNNFVDANDVLLVYNDASVFTTGYLQTDVTGDNASDLNDVLLTHNNSSNFVQRKAPAGAEPQPVAPFVTDSKDLVFENESTRIKYEKGIEELAKQKNEVKEYLPNWNPMPTQEYLNKLDRAREERSKIKNDRHGLE